MSKPSADLRRTEEQLVSFIRRRDYRLVRELGEGACGKTVLLHDDQIDEHFVCKKYQPYAECYRAELFEAFVREIKLLHRLYHRNVVRVFNYYLYPTTATGYILMEYVDGCGIDDYLKESPERINECFVQAVSGFAHLESCGILHRDIRSANLMVTGEGTVKIIDLGFGKKVQVSADYKKSITLNWHCTPPDEFSQSIYDFRSEIYFVGKLFDALITERLITDFKYQVLLARMCARQPEHRPATFAEVETEVQSGRFSEMAFTDHEVSIYRRFATTVFGLVAKLERRAKYCQDPDRVLSKLADSFRSVNMEEHVPDGNKIVRCLVEGAYQYYPDKARTISVETLRLFLELFTRCSEARRRTILANLYGKLDAIDRYDAIPFDAEDIPF